MQRKNVSMITSLCKKKYSTATDSSTKKKTSFDVNEKAIFHCKCSFVSAPVFSTTVVTSTEAAITLFNSPNTHNDYKVLLLPQYLKPNPFFKDFRSIVIVKNNDSFVRKLINKVNPNCRQLS